MDDCRSIITGIFTIKYRIAYRGFTQIAFSVALCYACMNGSIQIAVNEMHFLADFQKYYGQTGILTQRNSFFLSQLEVLNQGSKDFPAQRRFFFNSGISDLVHHLLREIVAGIHAQLGNNISDFTNFYFSHVFILLSSHCHCENNICILRLNGRCV